MSGPLGAMLASGHGAPAYALGVALTIMLAAYLTPARWWRRPTARNLAILGGGGWACGALLLAVFAAAPVALPDAAALADLPVHAAALPGDAPEQQATAPDAGARYRVHRDLNVRDAAGVGAGRLAVIPAGSIVTSTGEHRGDWWRIRYDGADGRRLGWASSLWLRRMAEQARQD